MPKYRALVEFEMTDYDANSMHGERIIGQAIKDRFDGTAAHVTNVTVTRLANENGYIMTVKKVRDMMDWSLTDSVRFVKSAEWEKPAIHEIDGVPVIKVTVIANNVGGGYLYFVAKD